jgi:hypothetical protein
VSRFLPKGFSGVLDSRFVAAYNNTAFSFWAILPIAPKPSSLAPSVLVCIGEKASLHAMRNKRRGYGVEYHLSSLQANHKTSKLSRDVARGSRRSQRIMKFQLLKAVVPPGSTQATKPESIGSHLTRNKKPMQLATSC